MSFLIDIPKGGQDTLEFTAEIGEIVFVLGANGTGKSSLMQRLRREHRTNSRWISAHRQTWFSSSTLAMSPLQKDQFQNQIENQDLQPTARWKDDQSANRTNITIYDLISAQNIRARAIAAAVDAKDLKRAEELSEKDAPIEVINELLRLSNIPIEISVEGDSEVLARKSDGEPYSVAELSDGERNALLIAAKVLTVEPGTLILVDEPERHLHRSIISPLLSLLFSYRTDCTFVVSTHDILLPLDNPKAKCLLVRGCAYERTYVSSWDADLIPSGEAIDEEIKKDILGSRRHIIFVEGTDQSLDRPLYSLLFKGVSVVAKSSCGEVEKAVAGIRGAEGLHWVHAWGIVDNDRRPQSEIDALKSKCVYALPVFSVEAVYYHPEMQRRVAARQASVSGGCAEHMVQEANDAAVAAIRPHIERLSNRSAEAAVRKEFFSYLPNRNDVSAITSPLKFEVDVPARVLEERQHLSDAVDRKDLEAIFSHYPIRETPALAEIAKKLGFQNKTKYERAVLKLLEDDRDALDFTRSLFGSLYADIGVV